MYSTSTVIWPYMSSAAYIVSYPYPLIYLDFSSRKCIVNINFAIVQLYFTVSFVNFCSFVFKVLCDHVHSNKIWMRLGEEACYVLKC